MVKGPFPFPSAEQLRSLAQQFGLRLIVLFGSAARGNFGAESDIDIGVLENISF